MLSDKERKQIAESMGINGYSWLGAYAEKIERAVLAEASQAESVFEASRAKAADTFGKCPCGHECKVSQQVQPKGDNEKIIDMLLIDAHVDASASIVDRLDALQRHWYLTAREDARRELSQQVQGDYTPASVGNELHNIATHQYYIGNEALADDLENLVRILWGFSKAIPTPKQVQGDRAMLLRLMKAFDSEIHVCDACGHEEYTAHFDSAGFLRDYLRDNPVPTPKQEPVMYQAACSGLWYKNPDSCGDIIAIKVGDTVVNLPAQAAAMPENWEQLIIEAMEEGFYVRQISGNLADEALVLDDTQIGVEFAISYFKRWLSAAPKQSHEPPQPLRITNEDADK